MGYAFSELLNRPSERIDTQLALTALEMAYRRRKPPKGSIPPGPRRSAMCLPIWSLSTIPTALTPLWVGFLPLVLRRNFATPLPNHWYHIPRQSFQVFSCFSVRFSGSCPHTNITPGQFPTAHFHYGTFPLPDSPEPYLTAETGDVIISLADS